MLPAARWGACWFALGKGRLGVQQADAGLARIGRGVSSLRRDVKWRRSGKMIEKLGLFRHFFIKGLKLKRFRPRFSRAAGFCIDRVAYLGRARGQAWNEAGFLAAQLFAPNAPANIA